MVIRPCSARVLLQCDNFIENKEIRTPYEDLEFGELSLKNTESSEVKKFAQTMINDHTKAGNESKALAQRGTFLFLPT